MIGYTTIGTNDLTRAVGFYDALFEALGVKKIEANERITLWATKPGQGMLGVSVPFDGEPATVGNGTMVALNVGEKSLVDSLHAKALELGAADEGAPGPRGSGSFYGGYFRDLDGNKLVFYALV
jgi:catechol 2,3-dioxygenase-like lactoylglutathione lyase family enzyme